MKINKQILLAALTLGAVTARADFTINSGGNGVGTGNVIGTPGSSGTSDYQLVLTGASPTYIAAGGYVLNDYSGQLSSFSYDASASQINLNNAQTLAAGTYVEVVDWTLKPTATVGSQDLIISGDFLEVMWFQGLTAFLQPPKVIAPYDRTAF